MKNLKFLFVTGNQKLKLKKKTCKLFVLIKNYETV